MVVVERVVEEVEFEGGGRVKKKKKSSPKEGEMYLWHNGGP